MKKILYATLGLIGIILTACPYEGTVELNTYEESIKLDKGLIDEWVSFSEEGARQELVIEKIAKTVLQVSLKEFTKSNKLENREAFRVYGTEIAGFDIFNVETKDGKYCYTKYGWTGKNEFYLQFVNADYMEENFKVDSVTTENLREFFIENVNKKELFDPKVEFYRKHSPEYEKVKIFMRKSGF